MKANCSLNCVRCDKSNEEKMLCVSLNTIPILAKVLDKVENLESELEALKATPIETSQTGFNSIEVEPISDEEEAV